jgi:hypothetical protein
MKEIELEEKILFKSATKGSTISAPKYEMLFKSTNLIQLKSPHGASSIDLISNFLKTYGSKNLIDVVIAKVEPLPLTLSFEPQALRL